MLLGFGLLHRPQAYPSAAGKTIGCNYLVAFKTRFHLARTTIHARVRANFKETDHVEGCHRHRLVDTKVLDWADDTCIGSDSRQTY